MTSVQQHGYCVWVRQDCRWYLCVMTWSAIIHVVATWCFFSCMQTDARCITHCHNRCTYAHACRMMWYYVVLNITANMQPVVLEHVCNDCVSSLICMRCMCYIRTRSLRMQYVNILPVLKHGLRSLMCVRVRDRDNSLHNKCNNVLLTYVAGKSAWTSLSTSMCIRTRKMVNYADEGWSLRKLRWKPIAILTCKSFVKQWYRGERLIEPSSSWFPPKFPSG